jgi:hypothetical protein
MTKKRANQINGQFAPRTIEMLRSPAMRVLSLSGRRVLDRVEIELAQHGGKDNGKLPITYNDLIAFGVHDHAIGAGLRELEALGFVEIKRGIAGSATHRKPNLFRLTYRPANGNPETNEWARIGSIEQAENLVSEAREAKTKAVWKSPRRRKSSLAETASTGLNSRWRKPPASSLAETTSEVRWRKPPVTGLNSRWRKPPVLSRVSSHLAAEGRLGGE